MKLGARLPGPQAKNNGGLFISNDSLPAIFNKRIYGMLMGDISKNRSKTRIHFENS